jgi:hypothetical protein
MPTGFLIRAIPWSDNMVVLDEPFALFTSSEGATFVVTAKPVEIEGEKTSVVEGSLRDPGQPLEGTALDAL